mgnify:CR=1 FL=1
MHPACPPLAGAQGADWTARSRHFLTQVACKRLQPLVVGVIIGFIGFWFFPHCFSVPFPPPRSPASGGQLPATFPVDFVPLCIIRKARTNKVCPSPRYYIASNSAFNASADWMRLLGFSSRRPKIILLSLSGMALLISCGITFAVCHSFPVST